jgi:hypothetical protein
LNDEMAPIPQRNSDCFGHDDLSGSDFGCGQSGDGDFESGLDRWVRHDE